MSAVLGWSKIKWWVNGKGLAMRGVSAFLLFFLSALPGYGAVAVDVAVGPFHACALYDDGSVWCWGLMEGDKMRPGPFTAVRVADLPPATAIASGTFGSCAIDHEHQLWCWGLNYAASFKAKTPVASRHPFRMDNLPKVRAASIGYLHACVVTMFGKVICWGSNPCGELGCGDTEEHGEPQLVAGVDGVTSLSAGANKTCVVMDGGLASCWGSDNPTRPGRPFFFESNEPVILSASKVGRFRSVASGRNFVCGLRTTGQITCWGSNIMTQLGTRYPRAEHPSGVAGLGEVDGIDHATALSANGFGACAIQDGQVMCWGMILEPGELDTEPPWGSLPARVPGLTGVTRISVGDGMVCAVAAGKVLCWGLSEFPGGIGELVSKMAPDHPVPVPGLPD